MVNFAKNHQIRQKILPEIIITTNYDNYGYLVHIRTKNIGRGNTCKSNLCILLKYAILGQNYVRIPTDHNIAHYTAPLLIKF